MLYELVLFGGVFFWCLVAAVLTVVFFNVEDDEDYGGLTGIFFPFCVAAFYVFSNPPTISIYWVLTYLLIGVSWFFMMFRYRLGKLRNWMKKYPAGHFLGKDGKISTIKIMDENSKMYYIFRNEPSWGRFIDRLFCWPMSMIKMLVGDVVYDAYKWLEKKLIEYKNNFLNIT